MAPTLAAADRGNDLMDVHVHGIAGREPVGGRLRSGVGDSGAGEVGEGTESPVKNAISARRLRCPQRNSPR